MNEPFVNDTATLDDALGTNQLGDYVAKMVLQVETPFTLGVTGKWGSGKTSVLRRAFATLGGEPMEAAVPMGENKVEVPKEEWEKWRFDKRKPPLAWGELATSAKRTLCVWYSPWQHQAAQNPLIPLLLEIKAQYSTWDKLKARAPEVARRVGMTAATLLERAADAALALSMRPRRPVFRGLTKDVTTAWTEAAPKAPELGEGQRFHLLFEDAVEAVLASVPNSGAKAKGRLVIFIDDLDRCEEGVIVELLEAIKLYLGSRHCVFVLGMDDAALLSALGRHWAGRSEDANREYLEKLFQATLPVPPPREEKVREYVERRLKEHGVPGDLQHRLAKMIEELLEPNPRRIKNFTNSLGAAWGLFWAGLEEPVGTEERSKQAQRLVLFQYLRLHHRAVWRLLERQPWVLRCLTFVLLGSPPQDYEKLFPKDGPVGLAEQRILEHLLVQAFAHVLGDKTAASPDDQGRLTPRAERHRHLSIHEAIGLFSERLDRKRSDECFVRYYNKLIELDMILEPRFLHLADPASP